MKKYYIGLFLLSLLASCSGFLDEVDKDKLIPTETEHYAAVLLNEFSYQQAHFLNVDFMTDNIDQYDRYAETNRNALKTIYTWQREIEIDDDGQRINGINSAWVDIYEDIAIANYVIELIDDAKGSQQERDFIKGEAYFIRAYSYFNLLNLYGIPFDASNASSALGVPLRTDNGIEQTYSRESVQKGYDLIIRDLLEAKDLISKSGITKTKFHPSVSTCDLLLSRAYLYTENWVKVEEYASKVIDNNNLSKMVSSTAYVTESRQDVLYTSMIRRGTTDEVIFDDGWRVNNQLIKLYHADDLRLDAYFQNIRGRLGVVYYVKKRTDSFTALGQNYIRVAEAYLNRAEARYHNGGDAAGDLQTLLESRYSNTASISIASGEALLDQILTERRKELCFEEHHRWFDLRRMKNRPEITHLYSLTDSDGSVSSVESYTLFSDDLNYTLPIPLAERDNNPLIRNNERYDKLPQYN